MRRALVALILAGLVTTGPAGAADEVSHSKNIVPVDQIDAMTWTHQAVFKGNIMFVGTGDTGGGFDVFRLGEEDPIKRIGRFPCPATNEGAISRWGNFVFQPIEAAIPTLAGGVPQTGICGEEPESGGIRVVDVSDPAHPRKAGFIKLDCGSHNVSIVPHKGKLWLYNSNGCGANEVSPGLSTGQGGYAGTALTVEIIRFVPKDPSSSWIDSKPTLQIPERDETKMAGCHDITIFTSRDLGICVGTGRSLLLDVSDPPNPVGLGIMETGHTGPGGANFTWDGKYVFLNEIPGRALPYAESCAGPARKTAGIVDIWDVSDPYKPNRVATYENRREPPMWEFFHDDWRCFAMDVITIPMVDPKSYVALTSWGSAGLTVVDFSDPTSPKEIAHWMPLWGNITYWNYWYDGRIYLGENRFSNLAPCETHPNPSCGRPPNKWGRQASVRVLDIKGLAPTRDYRSGFVPQWQDTSDLSQ